MNTKIFVLLAMIFCHVMDDYRLQGILANMKQRSWWTKNAPGRLYNNDYLMALGMHAFSWAFMIMLPLAIYQYFKVGVFFVVLMFANFLVHFFVDDLKANKGIINLVTDQSIHLVQIICTFATWTLSSCNI